IETDAQWQSLCTAIGRPELAEAARYASADARVARRAEVDQMVSDWTRTRNASEVMTALQAAGIPAGVVQDNEQLYSDPQIKARDFVAVVDQPGIGDFPIAKLPIRTSPGMM